MKASFIKFNIKGGILAIGDLKKLVELADLVGWSHLHLGERQEVLAEIDLSYQENILEKCQATGLVFEFGTNRIPNIVSSYVAEDVFQRHAWMGEGMYREILSSFDFEPKLKVNIVDASQALVPLFTGHINILPSALTNYFYIALRSENMESVTYAPSLVYVNDLAQVVSLIEKNWESLDIESLTKQLLVWEKEYKLNVLPKNADLVVPRYRFPYYVGMNKGEIDCWLGIYRRNNDFPVAFLRSICEVAQMTQLGQINLTSWRSLIVKGIKEKDRILWESILNQHGINTRYSSNELNWQWPERDQEALRIKNALVNKLNENDIRTFGLTFSISTGNAFESNASVRIVKKGALPFYPLTAAICSFDMYVASDFQPNAMQYTLFEKNVSWGALVLRLRQLSRKYFQHFQLSAPKVQPKTEKPKSKPSLHIVYQCPECKNVYDPQYGDPAAGVEINTPFEKLPDSYFCFLCETKKSAFVPVQTKGFEALV